MVNYANVSEKASKEKTRMGSFDWLKGGPWSPWKGSSHGLLQVEFRCNVRRNAWEETSMAAKKRKSWRVMGSCEVFAFY